MSAISNLPKAKMETLSSGYGGLTNAEILIFEYGWINKNGTTLNFAITNANKEKTRDYYFAYPVG